MAMFSRRDIFDPRQLAAQFMGLVDEDRQALRADGVFHHFEFKIDQWDLVGGSFAFDTSFYSHIFSFLSC